jgi:hypothetical protein
MGMARSDLVFEIVVVLIIVVVAGGYVGLSTIGPNTPAASPSPVPEISGCVS